MIAEPPDLTVGTSERWRSTLRLVERFARAEVPILLLGPTGSGKTTIAAEIHRLSGRRERLVSSSIPAVPPELRHSILQGDVRGAFTGAVSDHSGLLEQGHRGTLFLDEIGLIPAPMQELLTVLEGQPITRVGDVRFCHVDTRLVFATNSRPQELLQSGVWRPESAYRLGYFWIELPGLRERIDPINGTVRGMARMRNGTKVKEYAEAPWGDAVADTGIVVRYRFAGREYDQENGLYYMRARYYDPALGRWVSEDPIGIEGGANLFAYSENDPVNRRDPSGLDPGCQPGQGVCLKELEVIAQRDAPGPGTNSAGGPGSLNEMLGDGWGRRHGYGEWLDGTVEPAGDAMAQQTGEDTPPGACGQATANLAVTALLDFSGARLLVGARRLATTGRALYNTGRVAGGRGLSTQMNNAFRFGEAYMASSQARRNELFAVGALGIVSGTAHDALSISGHDALSMGTTILGMFVVGVSTLGATIAWAKACL